ncbi:Pyridoxine 5'-phosphate synthase [Sinobacterium norvegicum]|uniref:Pyridoxine 5'-phosphate synthase n=1 Tax=Sinobacterium norvegicum TaxID=1641715 RepID=A0ABM9ABX9_9GAMM|nr:pyridoxine 5'-phosphate synthase [Sinobacterium norvegicum]CAH0990466.1 Pyridoxine 5'-phosphate synthase [Sinobacterium norvegicum]
MTALSINLNKIALIRNSRDTLYPDVVKHAQMCIDAGAHGITVHPRPDQRHIRADDCFALAKAIDVELNIEGNPFAPPMASDRPGVSDYPGFMTLIRQIKPAQCTLVPDSNSQLTSDHGFDLKQDFNRLQPIIDELKSLGVRSSLFMDPIDDQIELAAKLGADRIELYTGPYAEAVDTGGDIDASIAQFAQAAKTAKKCGLGLNAGHDLNTQNLPLFCRHLPHLLEVSIGHSFTIDCIEVGLQQAIANYLAALSTR